jgi:hypothetical protein
VTTPRFLGAVPPVLALLLPAAAAAQAARTPQVAVIDLRTVGGFDPRTVAGLSSLIASEAAHQGARVLAGADLRAFIGFDRERQLAGCGDDSCLAQIGGALGVDYLLAAEVGEVGGRWLLTLSLLDMAKAAGVGRTTRTAHSPGELVDVVPGAVAEVFAGLPGRRPSAPAAPAEPAAALPSAASHPAESTPPAASAIAPPPAADVAAPVPSSLPAAAAAPAPGGSGLRVAGWALVAAGAATAAAGAWAGLSARSMHASGLSSPPATAAALAQLRSDISARAWLADGLFAGAAVAAAAGAVLVSVAPVAVSPLPGGAALGLAGRF